jgi:protein-disulfide isomerase
VAVIAIFLLSSAATSVPMTTLPGRAAGDLRAVVGSPLALLFTALFVVGAVSLFAAFPSEPPAVAAFQAPSTFEPLTADQERQLAEWFDVQPKVDMPIPAEGAKVLVVKFNDFQCPPCKQTAQLYSGILAKWEATGQVRFVLKHFPLEPECNAAVTSTVHPAACEAAAAWNMARERNDGSAALFEEWLFANQGPPVLTSDQVKEGARKVAGITDFDARYPQELVAVRNDAGMGDLLKVGSTPTFFINGHKIGGVEPRVFDALIALELKRAQ